MKAESVSIVQRVKRLLKIDVLANALALLRVTEERSRVIEDQLHNSLTLLRITEERSRVLEDQLHDSLTLLRVTEERSRTLQYLSNQSLLAVNYQIDMLQKWYVESMLATSSFANNPALASAGSIRLETAYPIALMSNDHIAPESTSEGIVRPTPFVKHCIEVLGQDIRCLDLGVGAAGLVFEYIMNGIVAIGVDGSNFCRQNKIGYWPLLPDNLYTCDITHPFKFKQADEDGPVNFDVITMWEVLEHICESDLASLFHNVHAHLELSGYFIGSISLVEYVDAKGVPYHVTLKPKSWWQEKFRENGLIMLDDHPFNERLFCRGNGPRFQDIHNYFANPNEGFHFVARLIDRS